MSDAENDAPELTEEEKAAQKAAAKAEKDRIAAEKKAAREAEKERKRAEREAAKEAAKQEKEAKKAAEAAEKERLKAERAAERENSRMPEQNGVRRPKPDTLCGKAWSIFDAVSNKNGAPASIGESMVHAKEQGLNEANVRAEYARWRKFYGISGRIPAPKAEAATAEA